MGEESPRRVSEGVAKGQEANRFVYYPDLGYAFTGKPIKVHFKHMQLIVCPLYLNKAVKNSQASWRWVFGSLRDAAAWNKP